MFCWCFGCFNEIIDHGGRRGDMTRALAQWQHLVASHEATNALHWVMRIALYRPGAMAIKTVVDLPAFFVIINSIFAHNVS